MADHARTDDDPQLAPALTLAAAVLLTLAALAVYVILRNEGNTLSGAMLFMLPIITALYAKAGIDASSITTRRRLDRQDAQLAQITHQTNGVLDEKIKNGALAAIAEHDAQIGRTVTAIQAAAQGAVVATTPPAETPPG